MKLARDARAIIHLTFAELPDGAVVEVEFGRDGIWIPITGTGQVRSFLVAGPDIDQGDAIKVISATVEVRARVVANPEILPLSFSEGIILG